MTVDVILIEASHENSPGVLFTIRRQRLGRSRRPNIADRGGSTANSASLGMAGLCRAGGRRSGQNMPRLVAGAIFRSSVYYIVAAWRGLRSIGAEQCSALRQTARQEPSPYHRGWFLFSGEGWLWDLSDGLGGVCAMLCRPLAVSPEKVLFGSRARTSSARRSRSWVRLSGRRRRARRSIC
jgi:hypothetical protein